MESVTLTHSLSGPLPPLVLSVYDRNVHNSKPRARSRRSRQHSAHHCVALPAHTLLARCLSYRTQIDYRFLSFGAGAAYKQIGPFNREHRYAAAHAAVRPYQPDDRVPAELLTDPGALQLP